MARVAVMGSLLRGQPPQQAPWAHVSMRHLDDGSMFVDFNTSWTKDDAVRAQRRNFFDLMLSATRQLQHGQAHFKPGENKGWIVAGGAEAQREVLANFEQLGFTFGREELRRFARTPALAGPCEGSCSQQPSGASPAPVPEIRSQVPASQSPPHPSTTTAGKPSWLQHTTAVPVTGPMPRQNHSNSMAMQQQQQQQQQHQQHQQQQQPQQQQQQQAFAVVPPPSPSFQLPGWQQVPTLRSTGMCPATHPLPPIVWQGQGQGPPPEAAANQYSQSTMAAAANHNHNHNSPTPATPGYDSAQANVNANAIANAAQPTLAVAVPLAVSPVAAPQHEPPRNCWFPDASQMMQSSPQQQWPQQQQQQLTQQQQQQQQQLTQQQLTQPQSQPQSQPVTPPSSARSRSAFLARNSAGARSPVAASPEPLSDSATHMLAASREPSPASPSDVELQRVQSPFFATRAVVDIASSPGLTLSSSSLRAGIQCQVAQPLVPPPNSQAGPPQETLGEVVPPDPPPPAPASGPPAGRLQLQAEAQPEDWGQRSSFEQQPPPSELDAPAPAPAPVSPPEAEAGEESSERHTTIDPYLTETHTHTHTHTEPAGPAAPAAPAAPAEPAEPAGSATPGIASISQVEPQALPAPTQRLTSQEDPGQSQGNKRQAEEHNVIPECVICMDARADTVFVPCGHMATCNGCAALLKKKPCPVCRKKIRHTQKVYM